jgi:hypothetical protein
VSCARGFAWVTLALATTIPHCAAAQPSAVAWKLDGQEAQKLAAATGHVKFPEDLDFQDRMTGPSFFIYYGVNQPPAEGGFGFFAVNRWTGDVWDLWGCHELSTLALRKSQRQIRRRFTRHELKQYSRLAQLKPGCI